MWSALHHRAPVAERVRRLVTWPPATAVGLRAQPEDLQDTFVGAPVGG